jgi:hypothetical protein
MNGLCCAACRGDSIANAFHVHKLGESFRVACQLAGEGGLPLDLGRRTGMGGFIAWAK